MVEYALLISNLFGGLVGTVSHILNTSVAFGPLVLPVPVLLVILVVILGVVVLKS